MTRLPAVRFRRKIYAAGPFHMDAINLMFKGMGKLAISKIYDRVADGKENIEFGFANEDGSDWHLSDSQAGRKIMYGFEASY